jgi:hypothetical protein
MKKEMKSRNYANSMELTPVKDRNSNTNENMTKIHFIKSLDRHEKKDIVKLILDDYKEKEKLDYFSYLSNIAYGAINKKSKYDKDNNLLPYKYVGPEDVFNSSRTKQNLNASTYKNRNMSFYKKIKRGHSNKYLNDCFQIIDNKMLSSYFNDIKKRVFNRKNRTVNNKLIFKKIPFPIKNSLMQQENVFKTELKNKNINKKLNHKLLLKSLKNENDLLINRIRDFQIKTQEKIIMNKNLTNDLKYRDNYWNITLRNPLINGKYEKAGYLNIGTDIDPKFTTFNINKNLEFIKNPKSENKNYYTITDVNELNHRVNTKQELNHLNSLKSLEINGKNLLNFEIERESKTRGKIILYNKKNVEYLYLKEKERKGDKKKENIREIDDFRIFGKNFNMRDFYKNENINSRYKSSLVN